MKFNLLAFVVAIQAGCLFAPLDAVAQEPTQARDAIELKAHELKAENERLSDEVIKLAIEKELLSSHAVEGNKIEARVDNGIVTLSGSVGHLIAQDVAVSIAQRIRGVKSVVDLIEVSCDRLPNEQVEKDISAAIAADPATHSMHVTVTVEVGVATLTGEVSTYGEKKLVERVSEGVTGIIELKNELTVATHVEVSDSVLRKEISELYPFAVLLDDATIDVTVKEGNVFLNGVVSTVFQRNLAEQLAFQAGAKSVDARGVDINGLHSDRVLRQTRYKRVTDANIKAAIELGWRHDPRLVGFDPQVDVVHGVATLSGTLGDLAASQAAEKTARYTLGVRHIKNEFKIHWPDEKPSDEMIAANTREALRRDPYVDPANIKVDCDQAHVGLYGVVENEFEKQHAEWMARNQIGVVHVDNYLAPRAKWVGKSDEAIQKDLQDRLELMFVNDAENQVRCKVVDGVALLEGTVDSWFMWQEAVGQAVAAGAREPHVMIEVRYTAATGLPYYGPRDYVPE